MSSTSDTSTNQTKEHRWSGWPGAFCLDCGAEDKIEVCVGSGCEKLDWDTGTCPIHFNTPCPAGVDALVLEPSDEVIEPEEDDDEKW